MIKGRPKEPGIPCNPQRPLRIRTSTGLETKRKWLSLNICLVLYTWQKSTAKVKMHVGWLHTESYSKTLRLSVYKMLLRQSGLSNVFLLCKENVTQDRRYQYVGSILTLNCLLAAKRGGIPPLLSSIEKHRMIKYLIFLSYSRNYLGGTSHCSSSHSVNWSTW